MGEECEFTGSSERGVECLCTFEQQRCEGDQGRSQAGDQVSVGLMVPGGVLEQTHSTVYVCDVMTFTLSETKHCSTNTDTAQELRPSSHLEADDGRRKKLFVLTAMLSNC